MFKVLFRVSVLFFILCQSVRLYATDSVYLFKEGNIKLTIPNAHWHLQPRQEQNGFIVYVFKRDPIVDSSNRNIIPNFAVVIEKIDPKMDLVTYSVNKRGNAAFTVTKMFIDKDAIINFTNAIAYKGVYIDKYSLNHTVYVVHAINKGMGLQIILDTTTQTFPSVDPEFLQILKSIRN